MTMARHRDWKSRNYSWADESPPNFSVTLGALVDSNETAFLAVVLAELWKLIVTRSYLVTLHADLLGIIGRFHSFSVHRLRECDPDT